MSHRPITHAQHGHSHSANPANRLLRAVAVAVDVAEAVVEAVDAPQTAPVRVACPMRPHHPLQPPQLNHRQRPLHQPRTARLGASSQVRFCMQRPSAHGSRQLPRKLPNANLLPSASSSRCVLQDHHGIWCLHSRQRTTHLQDAIQHLRGHQGRPVTIDALSNVLLLEGRVRDDLVAQLRTNAKVDVVDMDGALSFAYR